MCFTPYVHVNWEQIKVLKIKRNRSFWPEACNFLSFSPSFKIKNMNPMRITTLCIVSGILLSSCDWHIQTVVGTGDIESMEVEVPSFSGVSVTGTCNVDIVTGETQFVSFHAQKEILDVMLFDVKDHILYIGFKPGYTVHNTENISASIVIPSLSQISITGAGDFDLKGSKQELLNIHITGSGNVSAFELEVEDCNIRISGAGNCEVNVADHLDVLISGVGNVFYQGTPALSSDISGVGNVTPANP